MSDQQINDGSRVRVQVYRRGYHKRNFTATARGWTKSGLLRVNEDGTNYEQRISSEHVRLIKQ